jgi:hypothetical protein
MEVEHYIDGQHNGGVYNSGNLNTYQYTYQNPIRYIDPNGKQVDVIVDSGKYSKFDVGHSLYQWVMVLIRLFTPTEDGMVLMKILQVLIHL